MNDSFDDGTRRLHELIEKHSGEPDQYVPQHEQAHVVLGRGTRMNTTPVIRCPQCEHLIDNHSKYICEDCPCRMTPNLIAVAAVHAALFGELTQ